MLTIPGAVHYSRVLVFGEMVALLSEDRRHEDAIELEKLWNQRAVPHRLSMFCAYPRRIYSADDHSVIDRICAQHSQVVP